MCDVDYSRRWWWLQPVQRQRKSIIMVLVVKLLVSLWQLFLWPVLLLFRPFHSLQQQLFRYSTNTRTKRNDIFSFCEWKNLGYETSVICFVVDSNKKRPPQRRNTNTVHVVAIKYNKSQQRLPQPLQQRNQVLNHTYSLLLSHLHTESIDCWY